jgi:hypothetical protein
VTLGVTPLRVGQEAHHGGYIVQSIAGHQELLGPDVTISHLLLKNHVADLIGRSAYALVTESAVAHLSTFHWRAHSRSPSSTSITRPSGRASSRSPDERSCSP